MSESSDYQPTQTFSGKRLISIMMIVSVIAVAGSLWFRDWRITSGLALGCCLSLVNFWWSNKSLKALFDKNIDSAQPKFSVTVYFLRYLTLGAILGLAYYFNLISIVAALLGLLTFITAILTAAFIQLFFGLFKREEI
jgi:hypothetical protein